MKYHTKYVFLIVSTVAPVDVILEYSQGTITCSSSANPTVANNQYVITLNDTETSTGKTLTYDPEMNGCTSVKCTATNTIGTASGSLADPVSKYVHCHFYKVSASFSLWVQLLVARS